MHVLPPNCMWQRNLATVTMYCAVHQRLWNTDHDVRRDTSWFIVMRIGRCLEAIIDLKDKM